MKVKVLVLAAAATLVGAVGVRGQLPVITSFSGNGEVTWSDGTNGLSMYSVQWGSTLVSNDWRTGWQQQSAILTTLATNTVRVPMFYRICRGFGPKALDGVWVFEDVPSSFETDGDGGVMNLGAYYYCNPAGTYRVHTNGMVDMTIYQNKNDGTAIQRLTLQGPLLDANTWQFVIPDMTGLATRVQNTGALAGNWRGTIGPYTAVNMMIESNGYAFVVSNLAGNATGSAYMFGTNRVTGFFVTEMSRSSSWNQVHIRGVVNGGTNIVGDYELDEPTYWYTNTVNLTRQ